MLLCRYLADLVHPLSTVLVDSVELRCVWATQRRLGHALRQHSASWLPQLPPFGAGLLCRIRLCLDSGLSWWGVILLVGDGRLMISWWLLFSCLSSVRFLSSRSPSLLYLAHCLFSFGLHDLEPGWVVPLCRVVLDSFPCFVYLLPLGLDLIPGVGRVGYSCWMMRQHLVSLQCGGIS